MYRGDDLIHDETFVAHYKPEDEILEVGPKPPKPPKQPTGTTGGGTGTTGDGGTTTADPRRAPTRRRPARTPTPRA